MPITGNSGAAVQSSGISQPLNCQIPLADHHHLYNHHHHQLDHHQQQQQSHFYHTHYQSSLLAVVGTTPPAHPEDPQSAAERMTTDLSDWDVEAASEGKGEISTMMDNSAHGMISPPTAPDTQITTSNASSGASSTGEAPQQELWWTEGLVMQAQQEYPGELGKALDFR